MSKFKLCATIIKSGRVISTGQNKTRAPIDSNTPKGSKELWDVNICAEKNAIMKALKMQDGLRHLAGATIYVTRFSKDGMTAMAKPCAHCQEFIRSVGIKKAIYTNDKNTTSTMCMK